MEVVSGPEPPEVTKHPQVDLLGRVAGVLAASQEPPGQAHHPLLGLEHQSVEGAAVALSRPLDERRQSGCAVGAVPAHAGAAGYQRGGGHARHDDVRFMLSTTRLVAKVLASNRFEAQPGYDS